MDDVGRVAGPSQARKLNCRAGAAFDVRATPGLRCAQPSNRPMLLHGEDCQWYHPHVWNAKYKACGNLAPPAKQAAGMVMIMAGIVSLTFVSCHGSRPAPGSEQTQMRNNEALLDAAGKGQLALVEKLLRDGAQVNASDSGGITALHYAAAGGSLEVVQALLSAGADVNARTKEDVTPLMSAVGSPYSKNEVALALINAGADIDIADSNGETALWTATGESSNQVVEALLKEGANPNVRAYGGNTPLHMAALNGFVEKVRLLLKRGANPAIRNDAGQTPLDVANPRWPEVARLLREQTQNGK